MQKTQTCFFKTDFVVVIVIAILLLGCAPVVDQSAPTWTPIEVTPSVPGAPGQFKIGVVVFLTGGAAQPFGIPAKNGADIMVASINRGQAPAPYQTPGIAGVPISLVYVDESGGADQQVAEIRRLFLEEQVDLVVGYISSGDCLAVAPIAEELNKLTIIFDCGTSRLFEERDYQYVFRTNAHQAIDSLAGARYLLKIMPNVHAVAGINQNYAWGQDSWSHFRDTLLLFKPDIQIVNEQFPKLGAGDYSAEINALLEVNPDIIHTSFWGEDLKQLVLQGQDAGLFKTSAMLMSVGEYALPELGRNIPPGTIIGAHGPHGAMAPPGALQDWLVQIYRDAYGERPTYPVYHMAQAILGVKMALETAAVEQAYWPSDQQVIEAFTYMRYPTPSGMIEMAIGNGHQAVEPAVYGIAGTYNRQTKEVDILDSVVYPAACVNPPEGKTTEQWIKEGFPGSDCPD